MFWVFICLLIANWYKIPNDGEKIAVSSTVVPHFKPIAFKQEVPTCGDGAFPHNAVIGN